MSVKESSFNSLLRKKLSGVWIKIDRIESHATSAGIPDNAWLHGPSGKSGWLEVKQSEDIPAKIAYRPKQSLWLEDHYRRGGLCGTIIHIKNINQMIYIAGNQSYSAEANFKAMVAFGDVAGICLDHPNAWKDLATLIRSRNDQT